MFCDTKLSEIIASEEFLMEGLEKNFWRLIKLYQPEIWENIDESGDEYLWVIAIFGEYCIFKTATGIGFKLARYDNFGEVDAETDKPKPLGDIVSHIVNSRFKI
ncbi:hypothetical protein [Parashewanella curva]|nr:hypothetical protein [Parashewanella curva]